MMSNLNGANNSLHFWKTTGTRCLLQPQPPPQTTQMDAAAIVIPGAAAAFYIALLVAVLLVILRPALDSNNRSLVWVAACLAVWAAFQAAYVPMMVASSHFDVAWAASVSVIEAVAVAPLTLVNLRHYLTIQPISADNHLIHVLSDCLVVFIGAVGVVGAALDKWVLGDRHSSSAWTLQTAADWILLVLSAVPLLSFINRRRDFDSGVVAVVMLQGLLQSAVLAFFVGRDSGIVLDESDVLFVLIVLGAGVVNLIIFLGRRRSLLQVLHPLNKVVERLQLEHL
ncbi:hypothetical protein DFJ73DRAFT_50160 [Zopfochytrium polystomum]|nr:hypothetical protein DFJ73DRAFT_50160 [Zopfochytrium polystomum]